MRRYVSFIIIVPFFLFPETVNFLFGQNLVPNPSFENITSCPTGLSQYNLATPWAIPPGSITTPDLFNTCNVTACSVDEPNNFVGVAAPFSGNGYAGILAGSYTACPNCKEYLQMQLTAPLIANTQYCVSFRVLRASFTRVASNNIGMYISNGTVNQPGNQPINTVTPQINCLTIITDSANWTLISGLYTAVGGENYITIGNFYDDVNTLFFNYAPFATACTNAFITANAAYYYIDSVFVGTCSVLPVANFSASNNTICVGDCINFTDLTTNSPTAWNWSFPGGTPVSSTSQNPSAICYITPGTYTVTLNASNANGSDTATMSITVNPVPVASVTGNLSVCSGTSTTLTANPSGNNYSWSTGSTAQNITVTPTTTTNYSVIVSVGTCADTATVTVTVFPNPAVTVTPVNPLCNGQNTGTATANPSGGTAPYTYSWNNSQTGQTATGLGAGTYTVVVTDANNCTAIQTISITQPPALSVSVSSTPTSCTASTGTATVTPSGGTPAYTYLWSNTQTGQTATALAAGTYTVTITDANNCTQTQTVTVTSSNTLTLTTASTPTGCSANTGTATANPASGTTPYTYSWSNGQTTQIATGLAAGTYTVTVTDANGCTQTQTISVTQTAGPSASATASQTTIQLGGNSQLTAAGGGTYSWYPNTGLSCTTCANPLATPSQTTTYCVVVTDANGCSDSACVTIAVDFPCGSLDLSLLVPNACSPNGDSMNDELCVPLNPCIKSFVIKIYDRWGEKVFESDNLSNCWNGTVNGKPVNSAVFVYYLDAELINGENFSQKGNISLLK